MKCLSVRQPFASLIVCGVKRYETRSWPTPYRGPLAIHAGRRFTEADRSRCGEAALREVLRAAGYRVPSELPRGSVIGTATLADCLPAEEVAGELTELERQLGDFRPGRWAWRLIEPAVLLVPRPLVGQLGLFDGPALDGLRLASPIVSPGR
jgi:hypothetical protein